MDIEVLLAQPNYNHNLLVVGMCVSAAFALGQRNIQGQDQPAAFAPLTTPEQIFSAPTDEISTSAETSRICQPSQQVSATQQQFASAARSCSTRSCYQMLPTSLLYRSYIAGPHEPRLGTVALYDIGEGSWRWDSTLGGRVGILRRYNPPRLNHLDVLQLDLEGAVMVRLDPHKEMDLESSDYRFGLLWTGKRDHVAYKFGYFHVSSHVGDEYLAKNPTFSRINYVRESLIFGTAIQVSPEWRIYGEVAWGFIADGGAKPFQIQYGAEYAKIAATPLRGAPFAAINLQQRQETNFAAGVTAMSGWQWRNPQSGRAFRIGFQYFNGPSNQYQFYTRYDNQLGLGAWLDY